MHTAEAYGEKVIVDYDTISSEYGTSILENEHEDKMWKDTVSKKELSFISKFTKHCSKIFSNCKSAKITSAIKKMHSEVLSREVELHDFFDMKSIKDIIQKDEDASYPRIHYHSYEDVVKFTETLSEIVDMFDSTKVDL
jgi:hypothetical protein